MVEVFQSREVLTVKDVARGLKRPEATIRDWVFYKKIPYYKLNGNICFYGRDLNEWFESTYMVPGPDEEPKEHSSRVQRVDKRIIENFNDFVANLKNEN